MLASQTGVKPVKSNHKESIKRITALIVCMMASLATGIAVRGRWTTADGLKTEVITVSIVAGMLNLAVVGGVVYLLQSRS
jgi:multisubunit Na+/H+ antiporter MnhB subunit